MVLALNVAVAAFRARVPLLAVAILAGCAAVPPAPAPKPAPPPTPELPASYHRVGWEALPGWQDDAVNQVWPALLASCQALTRNGANAAWQEPCAAAQGFTPGDAAAARAFFEQHFSPYAVTGSDGAQTGLVTGYYEPLLLGSRIRSERFHVPLYGVPDDLLTIDLSDLYPDLKGKRLRGRLVGRKVVPYWPRAGIDAGQANVAGHELVYVEDPVEAFFLEIQGSGRIQLDDGSVIRVGYADQNGHPYRAVGRVLADLGLLPLERTSMQNIREWGRRNPDKLSEILEANPSYVFFREVSPAVPGSLEAAIDGPIGSLGVPLLARRAAAVDTRSIPLGAPIYLATTFPSSDRPLQRIVMAQDTGGAIRGAVRVDFFWGFGDGAGQEAGRMRQQGRVWLLWPKDAALPGDVAPGR